VSKGVKTGGLRLSGRLMTEVKRAQR